MSDTATPPAEEAPLTQTATLMMPPPPPTPPAPPGTAAGPDPDAPLTGLTVSPRGALAYAALVIVLNVGLSLVSGSAAVQQVLRALVFTLAGPRLANRELLAAAVSGGFALLGYVVILAPAFVLARRRGLRFAEAFGLRRFRVGQTAFLACGVVAGGIAVTVAYGLLLRVFGLSAPNNTVQLVQGFGSGPLAMAIGYVLVGVVAPFVEEVTFRGVVFSGLRARWGLAAGVVVSGVLFGIVHLELLEMLPLALIGMGLAAVFARTRSLWTSIIAHGCYNVVVLSIAFASAALVR
jgi:membrane protease YdiL (CAAX protease family)